MHATIFVKSDPVICDQPPASRQLTADKLVTTPAQQSRAEHSTAQHSLPPHNNSTFLRLSGHRLGRAVLSVAACCDQVIMAATPSSSYQREARTGCVIVIFNNHKQMIKHKYFNQQDPLHTLQPHR